MNLRIQGVPFDPAKLSGQDMAPAMRLALEANFGSVDGWRAEFVAMGNALGGGSGGVLLVLLPRDGTLVNQRCTDPAHAPAGGVNILAFDMCGLAGQMDFNAAATPDVDSFMASIDWSSVYERYQMAVHAASEPHGATQDDLSGALVIDVRRAGMFELAETLIPGARWRDPAAVGRWSAEIPTGQEVVVYCVYGHEVGRATALRLRSQGIPARFLRGGIDGWRAAGRPLEPKGVSS